MDEFNPNKRSRDDFDQGNSHGYDDNSYESKRQHVDPMQELINNVCKDIRGLGENPNIVNQIDDVSYISNPIVAEFEKVELLRTNILTTVYAIIVEQPQKINAVSNLFMICNAKNFVVTKYVVEYLHARMQEMLDTLHVGPEDAGVFNNIKSVLKFLAALNPVIEGDGVTSIFRQFLELAIDLQKATPEKRNGLAQEIYYNTLIAIPYLLSNEVNSNTELVGRMNDLISLAESFPVVENESNTLLQPFDSKLGSFNLPYEPAKIVDLILPALVKLQGEDKNWSPLQDRLFLNFAEIVKPFVESALSKNPISNEVVLHKLPQLSMPKLEGVVPTGLIDLLWYHNSRVLFQVYQNTAFETVPSITTYTGLFFKDLCFDILTNLSFNKTETSVQLSRLDLFFNRDLFAPPGSSIDELALIHADNESGENTPPLSTWKVEDIAVESILTMIFQLPKPLHYEIYYYTVLISCCRESPELIAPVFGRAIRFFYNNLETLDYELKIRFLDWMTIQISNFEFSWKWDEWVEDSRHFRNLKFHPKKNFIKNLIAKEIRLSNKNRIKDSFVTLNPETGDVSTLDEFYQYLNISIFNNTKEYDIELFGEEYKEAIEQIHELKAGQLAEKAAVSAQEDINYIFLNDTLPLHEVSNKIYDFVIAHWKTNTEFQELYNELTNALAETPSLDADKFIINVIFQTYAYIGSRSIYSVVSILSRDVHKLKFVSGMPVEYEDGEPHFEEQQLSSELFAKRQRCIIDCIFRIWSHQPQVIFLILEYLIEFGVVDPIFLMKKNLALEHNLIIDNVSCMESTNRILLQFLDKANEEQKQENEKVNNKPSEENTDEDMKAEEKEKEEKEEKEENKDDQNEEKTPTPSTNSQDTFQKLILLIFGSIVTNLNLISNQLGTASTDKIVISTLEDADEENTEVTSKIDNEWLYYDYIGLLKSYFRRYIKNNNISYLDEITTIFDGIENKLAKDHVLSWVKEI